jgi:hypothetical protein
MEWFGTLAISAQVTNFGRNNQIYDKFRKRAYDFRRGAELAKLGDYKLVWDVSDYIRGDVRGMMEQPLHSWMSEVIKTAEELKTKDNMFPSPETVAVATTWHPLIPSGRPAATNEELYAKAGEPCPRAGIWQPMEPGAAQRSYAVGETMANLGSAYGITVWRWIAER